MDRTDIDRQWRIVEEWLLSADARSAAVSEVRQLGLVGIDSDDLLSETSLRLWRSLDRREVAVDEGDDGRGLIRYARRTLRNAAVDSFRARRRRPEVLLDDLDLGAPGGTDRPDGAERLDSVLGSLATTTAEGETAPGAKWLDDARRDLHAGLDRDAVAGAAALMALGVLADDLALDDVVAQPDRGATRSQAAGWAGLWFAGRRDLFPTDADAAGRQRRSRAVRAVGVRIERAIEAVGGRG